MKKYAKPECRIRRFNRETIMTASGGATGYSAWVAEKNAKTAEVGLENVQTIKSYVIN